MKNKKKIIIIFIIITLSIGGLKCMSNKKEETEYIQAQKPRIEKYLKYNYNGIQTVTYEKETTTTPMGGLHIQGYVNNDKNLYFSATMFPPENFEAGASPSKDLDKMKKEEYKYQTKLVSEIEAEEKTQKK